MKTVRWGIIGCGNVTEVKSGPGFQKVQGSALVAVMRRDVAAAKDYAQRHGVARWYGDGAALIADAEVDAVYVATPPGDHEHYAMQAAAAGKPCYVEKPMARNHAECQRMVAAFEKAGVPLFVAYYRRALPRFLKARELVRDGAIGVLTGVNYVYADGQALKARAEALPWRLVPERSGGGLVLDLGSHTLDIIAYIAGDLSDVQGIAGNVAGTHAAEDGVAMTFRIGRALGSAQWDFASAVNADVITFMGTRGRVSLSTFGNEPVELRTADGVQTFDLPNPLHVQQPLIQTMVDQLLGRGECPSTGATGARTQAVLDAVLKGYYGTREDGFWEKAWPGAPAAGRV